MVQSRVLIRVPKAASAALKRQGFAAAGSAFQVTPLFDVKPAAPALAAAGDAGSEWLLAQTHGEPDVENQWDLAHNMLIQAGLQGLAGGGGGVIVEPDLLQTWTLAKPEARPGTALAATAPCTVCRSA